MTAFDRPDKGGIVLKRTLCLLLALLLCFSCSACQNGYKSGMEFTCLLPQDISSLDPQTASDPAASLVIASIFEGLCRIDENGQAAPGVAKSWDSNENDTRFTFHLRKGAKWSSGERVTAQDFLFAIQRALRPETATPAADSFFVIRGAREIYENSGDPATLGVIVEDDYTLTFELVESYPDFPALTAGIHYMPCNQAYFEESAGHYGLSSEYLITNGPFTFASIYSWRTDPGQRSVSLVRSEYYRGQQDVLPESLKFLIDYDDSINADPVTALAQGQVDILSLPETAARQAEDQGCGVNALDDAVTGLLLNTQSDKLEQLATRQLLLKTLDRRTLIELGQSENTSEASGLMPDCVKWDGQPYYGEGEQVFIQQDDSAVQAIPSLLQMMEWDSIPSITVLCPDDEESIRVTNGILISWNSKLGTAFNMEPLPESEFRRRIADGEYEGALYTLRAGGTSPYNVLKAFQSDAAPALYHNSDFDGALEALSFDLSSYRELELQLQESCVFYPLFRDKTYYVMNPAVRGVTVSPDLGVDFTSARKKG